jgi:hypothetical protein
MNTRLPSLLVLAAALSTSALSAHSKDTPAIAYAVSDVSSYYGGYEKVSLGSAKETVRCALGAPRQELSPDVWVYHNYHADPALPIEPGCDTVVITFARGKVSDIKLVNDHATKLIAANVTVQSVRMIAASK